MSQPVPFSGHLNLFPSKLLQDFTGNLLCHFISLQMTENQLKD
jgi:hypothetical protein